MKQKWLFSKDRKASFAGPKALAVLSCALALLTAQPWTARASQPSQTAAVRSISGSTKVDGQSTNSQAAANTAPQNVVTINRRESASGESHARLQATWAAIHNWIATKLFVATSDTHVKQLDVRTPEQTKLEELPILEQIDVEEIERQQQLTPELQWTLEHLLLAPPAC